MTITREVPKVVITGGTAAGKTTIVNVVRNKLGQQGVLIVPEIASGLFQVGFPMPGRDTKWSQEWQRLFELANFELQMTIEQVFDLVAVESKSKLIVCDRGTLDCAAHLQGGVDELCRLFDKKELDLANEYAQVIHLQSLSVINPSQYMELNKHDQCHWRSLESAIELEKRIIEAWSNHSNRVIVPGGGGVDLVTQRVLQILEDYL